MPSNLTSQQIVQKWADRGAASGETVKAGVNAVTTAPGQLAAQQKALWLQRVTAAADKWANNVAAVSLNEWKTAMLNKGIPNMQNGYANGRAKFQRFMNAFLPYARQVSADIKAMPKGTIQQSKDRSNRAIDMFHNWKLQGGGIAPAPRPVGG